MSIFRRYAAATALALTLLVSGCANPPGTDGDLANEWPSIADPVGWTPEVSCQNYFGTSLILSRVRYTPVDCGADHSYEIFHVGQITGAEADLANPPDTGSVTYRKAWSECDTQASSFLGGPWRERKVWLSLSFPAYAPWVSGAKWFTCSMSRIGDLGADALAATGSLKGAFAEAQLQHSCFQVPEEGRGEAKSCTEPHNAEFVGVADWNLDLAAMDKEWDGNTAKLHAPCRTLINTFVGASVNSGTWLKKPSDSDWEAGDRSMRCFLYTGDISLKRSMKGVGAKGWLK